MPRKTTGCWTCRARKKKCDDVRPACSSCTSRSITCYGYGAKPEWMDRGELERNMMKAMKLQINARYKTRRSKNSHPRSRQTFYEASITSPPLVPSLHASTPGSYTSYLWNGPHLVEGQGLIRESEHHSYQSISNGLASSSPNPRSETNFPFTERELNMLMYYLDQIFPRMCPYFPNSLSDNGRGWLLNLLLRTKPLCAAAVCLSECDRKQFELGPLNDSPQSNHDLEMQHVQIVTDIRDHLDQLSAKTGVYRMAAVVEALACIMHLIMFELWIPQKGSTNDWVMHLDAASILLCSVALSDSRFTPSNFLASLPSEGLAEDVIARNFPVALLSEGEKSAFEFWLTQYTYFFINTAANLGFNPQFAQSAEWTRTIFHKGQARLKNMIGCEDWVLIALLDISELKEWKEQLQNNGALSLRELVQRAQVIEERLNQGLVALGCEKSLSKSTKAENQHMTTIIYVHGALAFLHAVTSGFRPRLPEIQESVSKTLEALEDMRDRSSINFPNWPYCISGCLALEADYPRFRALCPPRKKGTLPLVTATWTLETLEECWKIRASQGKGAETCHWAIAMNQLGTRLLLF